MKGEDIDLAAHFTIIKQCGVVLYGDEIQKVFAAVPKKDYIDSICSDIENAKEDIIEQPMYITLNLCRVLAFLKDGLYLSKEEGGKWGIEHLSLNYSLVSDALECYTTSKNMVVDESIANLFVKEMMLLIEEARLG